MTFALIFQTAIVRILKKVYICKIEVFQEQDGIHKVM